MKRILYPVYALVLVFTVLLSCTNEKSKKKITSKTKKSIPEGVVKSYHANGKIRTEISYKNGKKDGLAKEYYKTGIIFQEIEYKNGIKDGLAKRYYEDGTLYQQTPYVGGKMEGKQQRFRDDGNPSAEVVYFQDKPCMGLIEYTLNGDVKKKYPTIQIVPINTLLRDNKYILRLSMSDKSKTAEFYVGPLSKGGCLGVNAKMIWSSTQDKGVADLVYTLPPGHFAMEKINVIAKVKTQQGNYFITQRSYNLAVENK